MAITPQTARHGQNAIEITEQQRRMLSEMEHEIDQQIVEALAKSPHAPGVSVPLPARGQEFTPAMQSDLVARYRGAGWPEVHIKTTRQGEGQPELHSIELRVPREFK